MDEPDLTSLQINRKHEQRHQALSLVFTTGLPHVIPPAWFAASQGGCSWGYKCRDTSKDAALRMSYDVISTQEPINGEIEDHMTCPHRCHAEAFCACFFRLRSLSPCIYTPVLEPGFLGGDVVCRGIQ